jgi:hypothetical protein
MARSETKKNASRDAGQSGNFEAALAALLGPQPSRGWPDSQLYASRIEFTVGTGDELARIMRDLIMPSLTIRHVTTYRYRQPVASLEISPEPRSLHFVQDAFGNHVGCPASAPMRQIGRVEEGRISGSS